MNEGPLCPIILVGTKSDKRAEASETMTPKEFKAEFVQDEEAMQAVTNHNLITYIGCSARTQDKLIEVFREAIRSVI